MIEGPFPCPTTAHWDGPTLMWEDVSESERENREDDEEPPYLPQSPVDNPACDNPFNKGVVN